MQNCPNCNEKLIKNYLTTNNHFVTFVPTNEILDNEKINNLSLNYVFAYVCPKCGKIEFSKK